MQWIGTDKYYSENQYWFARWNCILYYSVVLLEPSVAKKRGLAGDTETEEDLTPLRKRVSFFLTSSFCFFFNVFIDEGNALIQKTGSWNGRQV